MTTSDRDVIPVRSHRLERVHVNEIASRVDLAELYNRDHKGITGIKVVNNGRSASMIRLINLRSTLKKLTNLLAGCLAGSHLAGWEGTLTFEAAGQGASLVIEKGSVHVADSSASAHCLGGGHEVAQLLIGTEAPDEVCEGGGIEVSGDAAELLEVLFPAQRPQMPNEDL